MKKVLIISFITVLASCNQTGSSTQDESEFREFGAFYEQFHADSIFQIEHIQFPLEGLPAKADSTTMADGSFRWQKEDWKMHKGFDFESSEYEIQLTPITNSLIVEKIIHKNGNFGIVRRFAKLGDSWYLIYYAGLNRILERTEPSSDGVMEG